MTLLIQAHEQPAHKCPQASTKHHVVDGRFAAILAEDFEALEWATILEALVGEPQKQAIKLCAWAERTDDPKGALLAWSRKHRKGTYRPQSHRPQEGAGVPAGRPEGNTPALPDTTTARSRDESLRGTLVNPERLAATAERLGV